MKANNNSTSLLSSLAFSFVSAVTAVWVGTVGAITAAFWVAAVWMGKALTQYAGAVGGRDAGALARAEVIFNIQPNADTT